MFQKLFRKIKSKSLMYFDNRTFRVLNSLPNSGQLTFVDIGAAGEIQPRWKPFSRKLNYIGFEPDERSISNIQNKSNNFLSYSILPHAISDQRGDIEFNLTRVPEKSSTYEPNDKVLKKFPDFQRFELTEKIKLSSVPMDEILEDEVDFIKIDIQGGELNVLKGADTTLERTLGLELEVEFIDMYKSQPLFGDLCELLSKKGFEFIDFLNLCRWEREDLDGLGQCIWGDALFLKGPEDINFNKLEINKISSYFTILIVHRRFDLIERTLQLLPDELSADFSEFKMQLNKAKSANNSVRFLVSSLNRVIAFFGSDYRIHLIY